MEIKYLALILFLFGIAIGSFLNVVVYRLRTGKTLGGRSECLSCGSTLSAMELIPVLSYIIQRGRCASCGCKYSPQYVLVELITGLVFASLAIHFGAYLVGQPLYIALLLHSVIAAILIVIAVYDLRHKIIPNSLVYPLILISLGLLFIEFSPSGISFRSLAEGFSYNSAFYAGALFFAFFGLLWLVSRGRWMGFGDAKLVIALGFLLGLSQGLTALAISFWIAAIVGILMLLLSRGSLTMKTEIPFGPYLILGFYLEFIFGWQIFLI